MLRKLDRALGEPLLAELAEQEHSRIDRPFFESLGRLWGPGREPGRGQLVELPMATEQVAVLLSSLQAERPRSIALVGEPGVGKTALFRLLARRLQAEGWTIFEAGASELLAGQSYFGQLEERLQRLVRKLEGARRLLWYIPDLHAMLLAGRHKYSSISILDFLLPYIESGRVRVITEAARRAFDQLTLEKPRFRSAFDVRRLEPLDEVATLELAGAWSAALSPAEGPPLLSAETLREAWHLTQQFLGTRVAPGNLMELLEGTRRRLAVLGAPATLTAEDLIATLGQLTGLPASILDDRQGLDLAALRALFEQRVMGQPEAIDTLVERVAMIKAGVCDPQRPFGVFLFAGPTGTGKTEIAKTLAEFLFGAAERLLRIDMSELQTPESLSRLIGDPEEGSGGSLAELVRRQPFAVVLLDEIEKAHPNVWDLFLQVFDDGRLTDRRGVTTDFRHAIVIMTSNLGGSVATAPGLGFREGSFREGTPAFTPGEVQKALGRASARSSSTASTAWWSSARWRGR